MRCDIAYVVLSHRDPQQVVRLVDRLTAHPRSHALVHHDGPAVPAGFAYPDRATVLARARTVQWGDFSLVASTLAALRAAHARLPFEWLILLSGQDYPLRPAEAIAAELAASPYDAYVRTVTAFPSGDRRWRRMHHVERRYFYRYRQLGRARRRPGLGQRALRRAAVRIRELQPVVDYVIGHPAGPDRIGVRRLRVPFSPAYACHWGSQWLTLRRTAVESILRTARARPDLMAHYARSWIPDESFFHTLLCNDDALVIRNESDRFMRWPARGADWHPRTLTKADLPDLLQSRARFARKFDAGVDAQVLDELDGVIC